MPEPAASHSQRSLQSVWAVGRYLSRYLVAGVAFEAVGTCKQCTHQATVISGGARWTTLLCLSTHTACRDAPMCYMVHIPVHIEPQNRHHVYIAWVKGVPDAAQLTTVPQNSTRVPYQAVLPHAIDWSRGHRIAAARLGSAGGIRPAQTEMIHVRVDRHESMQNTGRGRICAGACKQS